MANLVRVFGKKMRAKNTAADLDAIVAELLATQEKDVADDHYERKIHLSEVYKEQKSQAKKIAGMRQLLENIADKVGVERS